MKLSNKRRIAQASALVISNIGLISTLKTGFICPFLYCHGCPFAAFACPIGVLQHFIAIGQMPILTIGMLGIYGMLMGRALCGWACPFGTLQDLIGYFRRGEIREAHYTFTKYIVLLGVAISAWVSVDALFCKFCPSGSIFASIPFYMLNPEYSGFGIFFHMHMLSLTLTLILAYFVNRFWCRYLCPLAAICGLFNRLSLLEIYLDEKKCDKCGNCLKACTMGVGRMEEIDISTNCIKCGQCIEACPKGALNLRLKI